LYLAVEQVLWQLQVPLVGSPTLAALIALSVTGLILLSARPTQTRVARHLPGRAHDALNRSLRTLPWSTRVLMRLLSGFAQRLGRGGYLVLDEVIVEKAFAKRLRWAAKVYSFKDKRTLSGMVIVMLVWCSVDGQWRIPVGFRLWRPKRSCRATRYQTKLELACPLVTAVVQAGLPVGYIVFDTHYTAGWFTKRLARLKLTWQGTLDPQDDRILAWQEDGRARFGQHVAPEVALAPGRTGNGTADLCTEIRAVAVGRDKKPSRQFRVPGEQRSASRPDHPGRA